MLWNLLTWLSKQSTKIYLGRCKYFLVCLILNNCCLKNGPTLATFSFIFGLFATNICEKYPSSIWRQDSNPHPLKHELSPITTRPGLLHKQLLSVVLLREPLRYTKIFFLVAAIAPWFCLRLPSCGPRFQSQEHHLRFFQFVLNL